MMRDGKGRVRCPGASEVEIFPSACRKACTRRMVPGARAQWGAQPWRRLAGLCWLKEQGMGGRRATKRTAERRSQRGAQRHKSMSSALGTLDKHPVHGGRKPWRLRSRWGIGFHMRRRQSSANGAGGDGRKEAVDMRKRGETPAGMRLCNGGIAPCRRAVFRTRDWYWKGGDASEGEGALFCRGSYQIRRDSYP